LKEQKTIVVVGSINVDLVTNAERIPLVGETIAGRDFQTHHGGKGANQAVAIARLGYPVDLIARLGSDSFGDELREGLKRAGVGIDSVKQVEGSSGVAVIVVSPSGENCIVATPGANAMLSPADLEHHLEQIRSAGLVLAQLETPLETVRRLAEICDRENVPFMLDPAPAQTLPEDLLRLVTWFTPNETEAKFYAAELLQHRADGEDPTEMIRALMSTKVKNVLLKRGDRGFQITVGERIHSYPAFSVSAIDTTAAGDAFNGAFAVALMSGKSPVESGRFAAAAAAISVTRNGAQDSMPDLRDVQSLLEQENSKEQPFATETNLTFKSSSLEPNQQERRKS
jgi:ribokinase